jgi:3-hydroxyisobutyrate dehydrogenase-like beta-hydroxyacid dehydrogenase
MRIGFIGVGTMGSRMAVRLLNAGHELVVFDVREDAVAKMVENGASASVSPRHVAELTEIIVLMLPDSKSVEQAVLSETGVLGGVKRDAVLIDMSSSSPASTARLCNVLRQKEAHLVDAPVIGQPIGAQNGTLTIMVGGDKDVYERVSPILSVLGKRIYYIGKTGTGHALKAINNLLSATSLWASCEGLLLAQKAGVNIEKALEVINCSSGKSWSTENKFPNFIINGKYNMGFTLALTHKDIKTAIDLGAELGVPMIIGNAVQEIYSVAKNMLGDEEDQTKIFKLLELWAKNS